MDESCKRYGYNLTECENDLDSCLSENTSVIDCDYGFVYSDEYYKETTVSQVSSNLPYSAPILSAYSPNSCLQFNLVCGRSTLDAVANSLYFVGLFFGSALIGPLMDW